MKPNNWQIWIDTGGTFTDCLAYAPNGNLYRIKILSNGTLRGRILECLTEKKLHIEINWPVNQDIFQGYSFRLLHNNPVSAEIVRCDLEQGILEINRAMEISKGEEFEIFTGEEAPLLASRIATLTPRHQSLPELDMRLGSTKGTNALLERKGAKVAFITTEGFADLLEIGTQQRPDIFALNIIKIPALYAGVFTVNERIAANGEILLPLRDEEIRKLIEVLEIFTPDSVAIGLMNSYAEPRHEKKLKAALISSGYEFVSASHELAPEIKLLPRSQTAITDAYLSPVISNYLALVTKKLPTGTLKVMTSAGGLVDAALFKPKDSVLSGPAGGVVGAAHVARKHAKDRIIAFDMGGTSTDVSRYDGKYSYRFETSIGGISFFNPTISIETVVAGGGSICAFDGFKLTVGPQSAGASPGPACYGAGGPLAISDVNLLLGRIDPDNFGIPLDRKASREALGKLLARMEKAEMKEEILTGYLQIANEKMAEAIRKISISQGYDTADFALLAFGGAGGQHACAVAELLRIRDVIIPYDAGLLSAYGMGMAEIERFSSRQLLLSYQKVAEEIEDIFETMREEVFNKLKKEGIPQEKLYTRSRQIMMRFAGQENTLVVDYKTGSDPVQLFKESYQNLFGHWLEDEIIEVESLKLIAAAKSEITPAKNHHYSSYAPNFTKKVRSYIKNEWLEVPAYRWELLREGAFIAGPALIMGDSSTIFAEDHWTVTIGPDKDAILSRQNSNEITTSQLDDMAELELFTNRFKAVADEMGALLQRTSFSVNVKERMDFSCAMLDSRGFLIANAPHIPVHLGSLGVCVRSVLNKMEIGPGDVVITNHPGYGGSHLPDVTLVSAVFNEKKQCIGYVANRAHHAEIGGKTPGSMPADAKCLAEEGVVISPDYLIKSGIPRWKEIKSKLENAPYPTRSIHENLADLNGALASIQVGAESLKKLCRGFGSEKVTEYMEKLQNYGAECLAEAFSQTEGKQWQATESLDDGMAIAVKIVQNQQEIFFDFKGSAPIHPGNLNATFAIVSSAVIYVLRLMIDKDIPLNEGIMRHVHLNIPEGLLNPVFPDNPFSAPAVVGGNTETSQRIVDTLIKALRLAACSQGTMNNLIFGNDRFGFYETIGGGVGAGAGFHGASAVHQHMTNTRITDPEIMEFRYPVQLRSMAIRKSSGGVGRWQGGDGIVRQILFKVPVTLTLLSQHRKIAPYGMNGGASGKTGEQKVLRHTGETIKLKGMDTIDMQPGDQIIIKTPGGGGYGKP